jgi:ribonuclease R
VSKPRKKPAPFPTREEILKFIQDSPTRVGKREIARAFGLDSTQKMLLKKTLRELEADGALERGRGRRYGEPGVLPEITVVVVTGLDSEGEVLARPATWPDGRVPPLIRMAPERKGQPALGRGDRVLARLTPAGADTYHGRTIRRLADAPARVLGVFQWVDGRGRIRSTNRRDKADFLVDRADALEAQSGDLVLADVLPGRRLGPRQARVVERLGPMGDVRSISLVSILDHDIPSVFAKEALNEADSCGPAPLKSRVDLRGIPLVTIDGADARDFDDAVWTEPDSDPKNPGGWHLLVAIADVAWYVRPDSALDEAAYERGNSVYFPDRVVPMLPEALSNGWCSLKPGEDRSVLAAHLWIDAEGNVRRHKFVRGLMRSAARLTYDQMQAARDGRPDDVTGPLMDTVIAPLYGAYESLSRARERRGVLELELPERRVVVDRGGQVLRVETRARFDSHKLIEEFMIAANVAAAETLESLRQPSMYRVHDEPTREKLEALRDFLDSIGLKLSRGQVMRSSLFNQILRRAADTPHARLVHEVVLRTQAQAEYAPDNIGHFGLALLRYCHFTSPIRRYSDLLVHRALIRGLNLGDGGLEANHRDFQRMGEHLSMTERRAAAAERDAVDRFTAAYLADRVGTMFEGRINGVTRFGLFVTLSDSGGDGLVPISTLPDDFYIHDEARHVLRGRRTRREFRLGDAVEVLLVEADPVTGGMLLHLMEGAEARGGGARTRVKSGPRAGRGRQQRAKSRR